MDSGWAAVVGAIVGGCASLGATWLADYLRERRVTKLDRIRKDVLKRLLSGSKYEWRTMQVLSDAIGADDETTARLLLEVGARRSLAQGRNAWGMKDWPEDVAPPS